MQRIIRQHSRCTTHWGGDSIWHAHTGERADGGQGRRVLWLCVCVCALVWLWVCLYNREWKEGNTDRKRERLNFGVCTLVCRMDIWACSGVSIEKQPSNMSMDTDGTDIWNGSRYGSSHNRRQSYFRKNLFWKVNHGIRKFIHLESMLVLFVFDVFFLTSNFMRFSVLNIFHDP